MNKEATYFASPVPHYYEQPDDPAFHIFHYTWKHVLTGAGGIDVVWLRNRNEFLKLLSYWNSDERWNYQEY
jgi:hypothetical protein